ncbi:hypothetical protein SLEP1_g40024 [Rubroshorea leprosula]|uniref:Protein kinase domain-containing protein n=1 Tax=Rubroshorea leprosula TaxID=152421 RepID=A0AAV5L2B8_9ROSI|nr:hypothetical protein SLEP1_g40024 [Rubroshorea leprosula]
MESFFRAILSLFCFVLIVRVIELHAAKDECQPKKCNHHAIRFPFRLKEQPDHCGYSGFELSCNEENQTVLELPRNVKLFVKRINYKAQWIKLHDPVDCLPRQLPNLNLSASPFQDYRDKINGPPQKYTIFNCSGQKLKTLYEYSSYEIHCLSVPGFVVIAFPSNSRHAFNLLNCTRTLMNISVIAVSEDMLYYQSDVQLSWSKPNCRKCEVEGKKCRLKINNSITADDTECWGKSKKQRDRPKELLATGIILGSCLLGIIPFGLYRVHHSYKAEKEGQLKIENFLEDYKALKPSRYSYADIKRITVQFKEKLGEGAYGTVFKGRLSNDVLVAVKVLNNFRATGEEFINEVGSMCRIHHVNVTRLIGFCADGNKRALVYEYMPNESLEKFIFVAKDKDRFLGWEKLQDIAMGIAKGIEYLHQGCDQQILHFDIKPHNILLDHNFIPKISDFGLAKLCSKEQSAVSMTVARGTMGYIAPEILSRNFGKASYKSDVYSFGMLLLEMVGGRKNIDVTVESTSQVYFPEWVYNCLDKGEEFGIRIESEGHAKIARKLTIVGLWCIQWYPTDRPSMKAVVQMLEAEVNSLTVPPNPFGHGDGVRTASVNIPRKPINRELEVIFE